MSWTEFKREEIHLGGQWLGADGGKTLEVLDPATGERIGTVPEAGAVETRRAIEAAHAALGEWSRRPAAERAALLRNLAAAILANQEALAELLTREQGKPLAEARGEIGMSAAKYSVVRRGGAPPLRRRDPVALAGPSYPRDQRTHRGRRRDHPLELPVLDARPQDRPRIGGLAAPSSPSRLRKRRILASHGRRSPRSLASPPACSTS